MVATPAPAMGPSDSYCRPHSRGADHAVKNKFLCASRQNAANRNRLSPDRPPLDACPIHREEERPCPRWWQFDAAHGVPDSAPPTRLRLRRVRALTLGRRVCAGLRRASRPRLQQPCHGRVRCGRLCSRALSAAFEVRCLAQRGTAGWPWRGTKPETRDGGATGGMALCEQKPKRRRGLTAVRPCRRTPKRAHSREMECREGAVGRRARRSTVPLWPAAACPA